MRQVVLQFWVSVDGYSCDEDTELWLVMEEIARLKAEPGGEILAHGGTKFVRSLIQLGPVDQYRLWALPAATVQGAPLSGMN